MKCVIDHCRRPAICRYCDRHRPSGLPLDIERPTAPANDPTINVRLPSWMADAETLEVMPGHIPITVLRSLSPLEIAVLSGQWRDQAQRDPTEDLTVCLEAV